MGFVKSPSEINRIEAVLEAPRFVGAQTLSVQFETDEEVLASLLPPPLQPTGTPRVSVTVGRWQSNCVGDYRGGSVKLAATHDGVDGDYVLAMYMNGQRAVIFGREVLGEPKKLAESDLLRRGDALRGWIDRFGQRLIEARGEMEEDLGPAEVERFNYNFKARSAATGGGLEEDAILTRVRSRARVEVCLRGRGAIALAGSHHDPLDEIPVRSVLGATYVESDSSASCEIVARVPAADFAPYHHGRNDDWSLLDTTSNAIADSPS
jgi:acetoacetate decarboxylase